MAGGGGITAGRNPVEDRSQVRRRNKTVGPVELPLAGRPGDPPPWPLRKAADDDVAAAEAAFWADLWALPQATEWAKLSWNRTLARYTRLSVKADLDEDLERAKECRHLEDRLGLNPLSCLRLRWTVVGVRGDDQGHVEDVPGPPAVRRPPAGGAISEERRARVRVITGGAAG
jgi:hypothetical protein